MLNPSLKVLLVYDSPDSRTQIEQVLNSSDIDEFRLECVPAQVIIQGGTHNHVPDVCLVESVGQRAAQLIITLKATLNCPIIVITWNSGDEVLNALHCGATDCLIRNQLTAPRLEEALFAAVEQARTQAALGQYERWYLSLLENTSDLIFTQDLEGNFSSINRAAEKLTGYTQDEILGMNFRQIVAPEYAELVWKSTLRMLEDRRPSSRDLAIISKTWRRIPVRMSSHLVYDFGKPIGVQGVMRAQGRTVLLRAAG
jgi:PAS domain S-box-containing protein